MLSLPYTGFVSGGSLPFTIEVDNASNVEVTGVTVDLLKVSDFFFLEVCHSFILDF